MTNTKKKPELIMQATNLGAHGVLNFKQAMRNASVAIYADNGIGKTFLSRALRLIQNRTDIDFNTASKVESMLKLGSNDGEFKISFDGEEDEIALRRGSPALEVSASNSIYHVFNSDYIDENLRQQSFNINGNNIQGYIFDKGKVDLSKEKEHLEILALQRDAKKDSLDLEVKKITNDLDELSISKNLEFYKNCTNLEFIVNYKIKTDVTFDDAKKKYINLKDTPMDLPVIQEFDFKHDKGLLNNIRGFLATPFDRSSLEKEFVNKLIAKLDFIKQGIEEHKHSKTECPFCEQELLPKQLQLIKDYNAFLGDAEAEASENAKEYIKELHLLKKNVEKTYTEFLEALNLLKNYGKYIPSVKEIDLGEFIKFDTIESAVNLIELRLNSKVNSSELPIEDESLLQSIQDVKLYETKIENFSYEANKQITIANSKKANTKREKEKLRDECCESRVSHFKVVNKLSLEQYKELNNQVTILEESIQQKENTHKIEKKGQLLTTFNYYLKQFFGDKYTIDKDNFSIVFKKQSLAESAAKVLSDGEKNIVAFCYYLAEVHKIVDKKSDYDRLFFVIDDPVSSMDFKYVYKVAQSIRGLKKHFAIQNQPKLIIFTHHTSFISLLKTAGICKQAFYLSRKENHSTINSLKEEFILPYQSHLTDIYEVSKKIKAPCVNTGNSIRHVLESIQRFSSPNKRFTDFIVEIESELGRAFFTMINDLSHGGLGSDKTHTPEDLIDACVGTIEYIKNKYNGQILALDKRTQKEVKLKGANKPKRNVAA